MAARDDVVPGGRVARCTVVSLLPVDDLANVKAYESGVSSSSKLTSDTYLNSRLNKQVSCIVRVSEISTLGLVRS